MKPEPRPLGKGMPAFEAPTLKETAETKINIEQPAGGILTLPQALSLALLQNPELAAFSYEVRAREAQALQASLLPNPVFELELENVGGTGELSGFSGVEATAGVAQEILVAGKRAKRTRVAALGSDLAAWDYESVRLDVLTSVRQAFTDVLVAQDQVTLNEELLRLAEQVLQTVQRRVEAGRVSPAEASRAEVELSNTRVALERARRELTAARKRLAATWGSQIPAFEQVTGKIDTFYAIPEVEKLQLQIVQNPDLARWQTVLLQQQAVIDLEDARRIPNPAVFGGFRRLNEIETNAFTVGLAMPLPLFDRNQGARQEARYRLSQAERLQQSVEVQLSAGLTDAYNQLSAVYTEAQTLRASILPQAQNAYDVINEGYLMGRFTFLDVLDAQRTLFDARAQYLRSLGDFQKLAADVERLIGQPLEEIE